MGCMTAFNRIGCTYCGSSSALLTTVMRGEWAYKGHVTSDAVVNMDYKKEIIEMLDKIKVDQILRYIYIIISDILKENKNE